VKNHSNEDLGYVPAPFKYEYFFYSSNFVYKDTDAIKNHLYCSLKKNTFSFKFTHSLSTTQL